jgi:hypothetical protein
LTHVAASCGKWADITSVVPNAAGSCVRCGMVAVPAESSANARAMQSIAAGMGSSRQMSSEERKRICMPASIATSPGGSAQKFSRVAWDAPFPEHVASERG